MPGSPLDHLRRALAPRLVVALSRLRPRQALAAAAFRSSGRRLPLALFFAYDDPYAAIALPGLLRLANERPVDLTLYPLIARGIAQDPALAARQKHAVADAAVLALRGERDLIRKDPLAAADTAFLAEWTWAARDHAAINAFASAAVEALWFTSAGPVDTASFAALHHQILGHAPPEKVDGANAGLAENARRLRQWGHWESPAARLCGEWFFAHERLAQIAARVGELTGAAR